MRRKFSEYKMRYTLAFFMLCILNANSQPKPVKPAIANEPLAEKYLKDLKEKFNKLSSYKLNYKMITTNADAKSSSMEGSYTGSRDKFIIETKGLSIINNGAVQWNFNHEDKEIQINKISTTKSKIESPMSIIKNYSSLFKYRVKEKPSNGVIILELIPLNKNSNFFKIDLTLDIIKLQIISSKFYDRGGTRILYTITKTEENLGLSKSAFNPNSADYKGYEELDMR
jgi:outer membrane lipoprotein-sorting protein